MIGPMAPRAILLDALGTLVELEPPAPALRRLLHERHAVDVSEADAQRALRVEMGHYRDNCVHAADAAGLAALRERCAAILAEQLGEAVGDLDASELLPTLLESLQFRAFTEVPATLERWRAAGLRLVVASNWDISLHDVLERTGLRALLDGVATSAEVGASKPAPEVFEEALSLAGVGASEALHVGDSLSADVEGARGVGIEAVWLNRTGEPVPDGVAAIASLDQLRP
jgi:putative hydrolase of the HAD superfamily